MENPGGWWCDILNQGVGVMDSDEMYIQRVCVAAGCCIQWYEAIVFPCVCSIASCPVSSHCSCWINLNTACSGSNTARSNGRKLRRRRRKREVGALSSCVAMLSLSSCVIFSCLDTLWEGVYADWLLRSVADHAFPLPAKYVDWPIFSLCTFINALFPCSGICSD